MTPEEILKIIQNENKFNSDDFVQDCFLAVLEQKAETEYQIKSVCAEVARKHKHVALWEKYSIAPHLYNEEGECIDDNVYFKDKTTEEENVGTYVSDEDKETTSKLSKALDLCVCLFCSRKQREQSWVATTSSNKGKRNRKYGRIAFFKKIKRNSESFLHTRYSLLKYFSAYGVKWVSDTLKNERSKRDV